VKCDFSTRVGALPRHKDLPPFVRVAADVAYLANRHRYAPGLSPLSARLRRRNRAVPSWERVPIYVYRLISNFFVLIDALMLVWYICYELRSRAGVMRGSEIGVEARVGVLH
jgi:hypothetical protein